MAEEYRVDADLFWERAQRLYTAWQAGRASEGSAWHGVDALVVDTGKYDENALYLKSTAVHSWLFGLELPETVLVFTETMLYVLAGAKKVAILDGLMEKRPLDSSCSVLCYARNKADKDAANYATLAEKVRGSFDGKRAALILKEEPVGDAAAAWRAALAAAAATPLVDAGPIVSELLLVKDVAEQALVKRAALFSTALLSEHVVGVIESIVDEKRVKRHADLAADIEDFVARADVLTKLKIARDKIAEPAQLDTCYTPIIQSGGKFSLKPSAESNEDPLHDHVVTVSLGARYKSYCANIGRTYVINPTKQQAKEYAALLEAEEAVIKALQPGRPASDALQAALDALDAKEGGGALAAKLTRCVGFGTGLEFRDASFVLNAKNGKTVLEGMVFNLTLGLEGLENPAAKDPRSRSYALYLSDTVVVGAAGAELLTGRASKKWVDISYEIQEDDDVEEVEPPRRGKEGKENKPKGGASGSRSKVEVLETRTRGKGQQQAHAAIDEQLREHQTELEETLTAEALRRLDDEEGGGGGRAKRAAGSLVPTAYDSPDAYPREMNYNQICVDVRAESVLIPIYGAMVPFHITTIKNVAKSDEGNYTYLRVHFNPPGQGLGTAKEAGGLPEQLKLRDSLRELTLRAKDPKNLSNAFRMIKELRTRVMRRDKEAEEKRDLVVQEPLRMLAGARAHRLRDVNMRPHVSGRKSTGTVEIQANGIRYTSNKGEKVDILYRNMQNCFFQPAQKEHLVLLHFHLRNGIMVGKKKQTDVQFYVEVISQSDALDQVRRNGYDPDELDEEQRERQLRNRMNAEFKAFAQKMEEQAGDLEFDIPYRELGFHGLVNKTTSLIMPTVNALVELIEPPWMVVQIADIEIVHFERVIFGLKNFDMMVVFKELKRDPIQVGTINMTQLDQIKTWLDSCNIKFYEGVANLHWPAIMKTVREDPRGFYEGDSWRFLDLEQRVTDDEDEAESEEESSFAPTGSESEEESDDDDDADSGGGSDSDFQDSDADSDAEGSLDSDESSGKSWDEHEKEAVKTDRKRGADDDKPKGKGKRKDDDDSFDSASDDDSDRPKKKKGGAPPPAKGKAPPPKGKAPPPPLKKPKY